MLPRNKTAFMFKIPWFTCLRLAKPKFRLAEKKNVKTHMPKLGKLIDLPTGPFTKSFNCEIIAINFHITRVLLK